MSNPAETYASYMVPAIFIPISDRVVRTLRRGETIYNDALEGAARTPGTPGSGRYLARGYGERG